MKHLKSLLFILLAIIGQVKAQTKDPKNSLLWEISGNGLKKHSYLFGTYHFAGKSFVDTMQNLKSKLASSDVVVGEMLMNDSTLSTKLMPFMLLKNDSTLNQILNQQEYKLVDSVFKSLAGFSISYLNKFRPMVVQVTILQATAPRSIGKDNPAMDNYFQDYALQNKKPVIGLETVEDQGKVLFGASVAREKERLLAYIKDVKKYNEEGEKLYKFYTQQDLKNTAILFKNSEGFSTEEFDQLLKNRNQAWLKKLPDLMQQNSNFIAVGAGHLIGENGLIALLKAKGYTVKPIPTK